MIARCVSVIVVVSVAVVAAPWRCQAEGPPPVMGVWDDTAKVEGPWEATLEGRLGFPVGRLKVGEFPTGANKAGGGGTPGTLLHFNTLGVDHSEVIDASAAFHFTPRDAVRAGFLYYFLEGSTKISGPSVVYNGQEFTTGTLDTNSDFYRLSLDYERTLFGRPWQHELIGTVGLTYVSLNPKLTGQTKSGGGGESHGQSNSEDFYRQELPVPILGLRWTYPLSNRWFLRTSLSGGGLPRVDSGRTEGGTVFLQQAHADLGLAVVYRITDLVHVEAGYHLTYFFQKESSHEDKNLFELIDNGLAVRLGVRF
jgi:hypothetical protein